MYFKPLLLPLLLQVALTFAVWLRLYYARISEIQRKRIQPRTLATRNGRQGLLIDSEAASDNLMNLFEMPVLFYLAIVLALILMIQDPVLVAFAWLYVALRAVHSLIHITYNEVLHRFWAYFASSAALFVIWGRLAWHIL
jgi:hypothetical protein